MRVGILGAGFMGSTHARAFARLPDVQIVAISSRSLDKAKGLAAQFGALGTTSDQEIIDDPTIDAISNTVPTHLHPATTLAAMQAGKHVLLEKPLALNAAECDRIIAGRRADKVLMVAHVLRFWGEYETLVEIVQSGNLGKPLSAVATRLATAPGWASWFTNPELSGGATLDLMIHDYDALNWVMGAPKTVYARGQQAAPNLWNHVHTIIGYDGGDGFAEGSQLMPPDFPFTMALKVLCERGAAEFTFRAGGTSVDMGGGSHLTIYEPGRSYAPPVPEGSAYDRQIAYFADCVRAGKQPERGTLEQALLAVQVADAVRQSLETGALVTL
jgi:predicted dehydrogenase